MDLFSQLRDNAVLFGTVAVGIYFVTPMIQPMINSLPLVGNLSLGTQSALLAGGYSVIGANLNRRYSL